MESLQAKAKKGSELKSFHKLVVKISVEGGTIMDYRIEKKEEFRLLVYAKMFTEESSEKGIPAFGKSIIKMKYTRKHQDIWESVHRKKRVRGNLCTELAVTLMM